MRKELQIAFSAAALCLSIGFMSGAGTVSEPGAKAEPGTPGLVKLERREALFEGAVVLGGETGLYERVKQSDRLQMSLPLPQGGEALMTLSERQVLAPGAQIVVGYADGDVPVDPPPMRYFAGQVDGDADSLVVLGIDPDGIQGMMMLEGRMYSLSSGPHGSGRPLVLSDVARLPGHAITWKPFVCGVDEHTPGPLVPGADPPVGTISPPVPLNSGVCRIVKVALDTDWEFTATFGGDTDASTAYALLLMTASAEIYSRDFNIGLQVSFLRIWGDSNDPWTAQGIHEQLDEFREHWWNHMQHIERNVAHFITTRPLGGGLAYMSVLCNYWWHYGISANMGGYFPYPLIDHSHQNWDIFVLAHELGHNAGAPHTHDLNPPADGCGLGDCSHAWGGTIMSYCHICPGGMSNIVARFHERIINETVMPYLAGESCMPELVTPVFLSQPQSQQSCVGQWALFTVQLASWDPLTYQWRKDGVPIEDETGSSLLLSGVDWEDGGVYDVAVSNDCETVFSQPAELTVYTILGDLTGDGTVGHTDLAGLLAAWGSQPGDPTWNPDADLDGDGVVGHSDLAALLANYGLACE